MSASFTPLSCLSYDIYDRSIPANCRFEVDDVNNGLADYKEAFDVVHVRCVCTGIADYRAFLKDVAYEVLRPGGILLILEGDPRMYDQDLNPLTAENEDEPVSLITLLPTTPLLTHFLGLLFREPNAYGS